MSDDAPLWPDEDTLVNLRRATARAAGLPRGNSCKQPFVLFLRGCKDRTKKSTLESLVGGKWRIDTDNAAEFYTLLAQTLCSDVPIPLYLSERFRTDDDSPCKLYLDIDIKFTSNETPEMGAFDTVVNQIFECVRTVFPAHDASCVVCAPNAIRSIGDDGLQKYGFHLTFPFIGADVTTRMSVYQYLSDTLRDDFGDTINGTIKLTEPWDTIVDKNILSQPAQRLPYCFKCDPKTKQHSRSFHKFVRIITPNNTMTIESLDHLYQAVSFYLDQPPLAKVQLPDDFVLRDKVVAARGDDMTNVWGEVGYHEACQAFRSFVLYEFGDEVDESTFKMLAKTNLVSALSGKKPKITFKVNLKSRWCPNKLDEHRSSATYVQVREGCTDLEWKCYSKKTTTYEYELTCPEFVSRVQIPPRVYRTMFSKAFAFGRMNGIMGPVVRQKLPPGVLSVSEYEMLTDDNVKYWWRTFYRFANKFDGTMSEAFVRFKALFPPLRSALLL